MKQYSVKQISEILNINPETVRRWIRTGRLEAVQTSKKEGNIVSEESLKKFLRSTPKYAGIATGSALGSLTGLSVALTALLTGFAKNTVSNKEKSLSAKQLKEQLGKSITTYEQSIAEKEETIRQLQKEIRKEKSLVKEMKTLLNNKDFEEPLT